MQDTEEVDGRGLSSPKRRRKKKKKRRNLLDIPGVRRIVLSEPTQKIVECVVGKNVTSESPWTYVKKKLIQDNLELHGERSEFVPLREEMLIYPRPEILIGYIADETQDKDDEFYFCVTEEATDNVQKIIVKLRQEQDERLYSRLYKGIHQWQSMGSEAEVDESIVKTNRPLLEVEVETRYPIFPRKVQFRLLRAENKRDGYMELRCTAEENLSNVYMRRIDSAVQVAPALVSAEAQTTCTYPRNVATQYLYETGPIDSPKTIAHTNKYLDNLSDLLKVNGTINLYSDDYESLVKTANWAKGTTWTEFSKDLVEYLSFMEVNLCKGKMISDICWHKMWTGIVAIAYCDVSPNIFHTGLQKGDEVYTAVYTVNLVLIWSFSDTLKPKLILESPREIHRISFCDFDENILIGGCKNGQIVVWDLRKKLQKVEEKEILTTLQHKYRNFLHSLMGWMKDSHDIAIVRPAAVSDLRHSHKSAVSGVSWVEPHHHFSRTGTLSLLELDDEGNQKYSMQFVTSSLDGTVLIWDLKDKPEMHPGEYTLKRFNRFRQKPNTLQQEESPYRVLHLNLKPRCRINVNKKDDKNKSEAITRSYTSFCWLTYEEKDLSQLKKHDIKERVIYKPIMTNDRNIRPEIKIGTAEGNYVELHLEGQDIDSEEVVNIKQAKYIFYSKYHDGPITSLHTSCEDNTTLSVGGKIFALWRKDLPDRPILWRRSRQFFTKGELNPFQPFKIILHSVTGVLSHWMLPINSKSPIFTQVMSNGLLTASAIHPYSGDRAIYGIGDERGSFRLFYFEQTSEAESTHIKKLMEVFINREINRKKLFLSWQENFNKRNEIYLTKIKEKAEEKVKEETAKEKKKDMKLPERPVKKGPQPGKYIDGIREQRHLRNEARIKAMIIKKKQLDTEELEKRRQPLLKLDEENERKKRRQKERLKQGDFIFRDTVASLFPDVVKEISPSPPDPYGGGQSEDILANCYMYYEDLSKDANEFIITHPLKHNFTFKDLLVASKAKDTSKFHSHIHTKRYEEEKKLLRRRENEDQIEVIESKNQKEESKENNPDEQELKKEA
ncbi:dynein axonemal intermediate chain 3 [Euwallacea fornicatus]|uniref:dynein axonemal intermediate chain 3 n=1 Tax=Euwallacea fornicatus TaxID=995702 RepID=UPI00339032FE